MFRFCRVPAALLLLLATCTVLSADDAAALIEDYDLRVADAPVRERAGWRPPQRIVIAGADAARMAWLQEAVPDVELIAAPDAAAAPARMAGADGIVGLCNVEVLRAANELRWIQLLTAGVEDCLAPPEFAERAPLLTNMARVTGPVIAEHVMALMLALSRGLHRFGPEQQAGRWNPGAGGEGMQVIRGKTLLVAGLGGIGTETARRAHALGMTVTATRASRREGPDFVARVGLPQDLPALAAEADVVVNALPLTDDTRGLFDAELFGRMKPTALFINVGRGGTVVTDDLVAALRDGVIAGAGLDVTEPSPLPRGHPLWSAPNVIITPHIATRSDLGQEVRWQIVRENLRRYAAGEAMISVVDADRGY